MANDLVYARQLLQFALAAQSSTSSTCFYHCAPDSSVHCFHSSHFVLLCDNPSIISSEIELMMSAGRTIPHDIKYALRFFFKYHDLSAPRYPDLIRNARSWYKTL